MKNQNEQTLVYHRMNDDKVVHLLMPGQGKGITQDGFLMQMMDAFIEDGKNVAGFDYPFQNRGEKNPTADGSLSEEQEELVAVMESLYTIGYEKINCIAKSMSGIVLSKMLSEYPNAMNGGKTAILGQIVSGVKFEKGVLTENMEHTLDLVVQGTNDKYGSVKDVHNDLAKNNIDSSTKVIPIQNADHSYRDINADGSENENQTGENQRQVIQHIIAWAKELEKCDMTEQEINDVF